MNYLRSMFLWRGIRIKGIWRRQVEAYKARARRHAMLRGEPVEPPRVLTLQERLAARAAEFRKENV